MGSYSLKLNNSNSEKEFNSDSNSSVESDPFFYKNKANRPKKKAEKPRVKRPISITSLTHYCTILGLPIILLIIENDSSSLILIRGNYRF